MFARHLVNLAEFLAFDSEGSRSPMRTAMMAMTTSSSTSVKARRRNRGSLVGREYEGTKARTRRSRPEGDTRGSEIGGRGASRRSGRQFGLGPVDETDHATIGDFHELDDELFAFARGDEALGEEELLADSARGGIVLVFAFVGAGGGVVADIIIVVMLREFSGTVVGGVVVGGRKERLAQNKSEEDEQSAEPLPPRTRACARTVGVRLALPLLHWSLATNTS